MHVNYSSLLNAFRGLRTHLTIHFEKKLSTPLKIMYNRRNYWRAGGNGSPFPQPFMKPHPPMPLMSHSGPFISSPYSTVGDMRVRTVKCGELRTSDFGQEVEIAGRVQNMRMNRFLILRDETGITQLVAPDERVDLQKKMSRMPLDSYVRVRGEVLMRPSCSRNDSMATGSVEVLIHEFVTVQHKRKQLEHDDYDVSAKRKKTKPKSGGMKLTTEEVAKTETMEMRSYFAARSLTCADLSSESAHPGDVVSLCGWVLTKRPPLFIVLKDGHGEIQLVPAAVLKPEVTKQFKDVNLNDVIFIKGILARRPFGQGNPRVPNGLLEVSVTELTVVAKDSPFCAVEPIENPMEKDRSESPELDLKETEIDAGALNKYTKRTHTCGELRSSDVGKTVTLMGWLEFVRLTKFIILRDGYGNTQILISDSDVENNKLLNNLSLESIIKVTGTVCSRPNSQIKQDIATGEIEVLASCITVLNEAKKTLPFSIRDFKKAKEPLRMEHRYLDLRFKEIQNNLRTRSKVLMKMREFLIHHLGFVEVETPTLFKRTPGGAREFVVPTHQPGLFYSLVQSPQQLKQLLMVGAIDRYFQVARCYRDESTKPDRQPEFTQLDIELSFCGQEEVMKLVEDLLEFCWPGDTKVTTPFFRMTYNEAMENYGTDKPDLRIEAKFTSLTDEFCKVVTDGKVEVREKINEGSFSAYGIVMKRGNVVISTTLKKSAEEKMKANFPLTTSFFLSGTVKSVEERLLTLFGPEVSAALLAKVEFKEDSILFLAMGHKQQVLEGLGAFRLSWADQMEQKGVYLRTKNELKCLWVTDFPLFTSGENGKLESNHHPFTAPTEEHESDLFENPLKVTGMHYDLVINGSEVGGGSIRIHNGEVQERVLKEILNLPTESLSHLLAALRSGAPPHGGIALGIDRLIAIMVGASSIRDVIAFPKSIDGKDPLTGAPGPLTDEEITYYHLAPGRVDTAN